MWKYDYSNLDKKKYYKTTRYGYARGNEAVTYVDNIRRYYDTLVWLDEQQPPILESEVVPDNTSAESVTEVAD